jgi:hypothetical protein
MPAATSARISRLKMEVCNRLYGGPFRKPESCISMVQSAKNRMRNDVSELLDLARVGRVFPERNMSSHLNIIGGIVRKNSSKVFCVEHDQMISALAPNRPDQAFDIPILPGRTQRSGPSRIPIARTRALNAVPNAPSLSRMRYFGAVSHGHASMIWRANHSAVGSPPMSRSQSRGGNDRGRRSGRRVDQSSPLPEVR